jgi:hypothetical protein
LTPGTSQPQNIEVELEVEVCARAGVDAALTSTDGDITQLRAALRGLLGTAGESLPTRLGLPRA